MEGRVITKFQLVIFFHVSIADKPDYLVTSVFEWLIELWSGRAKKVPTSGQLTLILESSGGAER